MLLLFSRSWRGSNNNNNRNNKKTDRAACFTDETGRTVPSQGARQKGCCHLAGYVIVGRVPGRGSGRRPLRPLRRGTGGVVSAGKGTRVSNFFSRLNYRYRLETVSSLFHPFLHETLPMELCVSDCCGTLLILSGRRPGRHLHAGVGVRAGADLPPFYYTTLFGFWGRYGEILI